jgi:hypothetical protein
MKYPLTLMTITEADVQIVATLIASIQEHLPVHEADDPIAAGELLADARKLLQRMVGDQPPPAAAKPIDWTGVPY